MKRFFVLLSLASVGFAGGVFAAGTVPAAGTASATVPVASTTVASTTTTPAAPDSVHAAADTVAVPGGKPAPRPSRSAPRPSRSDKSPGIAVLFSALFPGGGQLYTQNYFMAAVIGGGQATLEYFTIRDHLRAMDYLAKGDTINYYHYRDSRNNLLWWTASLWVFSLADAYVSANMYHFKQDETIGLVISPTAIGVRLSW